MLKMDKAAQLAERRDQSGGTAEPLRVCVERALDQYFADLEGHPPGDLYQMVMREVELPLFRSVMRYTGGNQTRAAEILGLNRSTLRKRLRAYDLD